MQSHLSAAHFHSEEAAYAFAEARLWPDGPVCPHCGATKEHVGRLKGKTNRIGLCKCYACRKPFTVKIGTVFESSHVLMRVWLQAIYLFCSSKKGISTRQLQRTFNCGLKKPLGSLGIASARRCGISVSPTLARLAAQIRSSRRTKPTSAAGRQIGKAKSRPRRSCCLWSSATAASAAFACRM